jgi:hypothetical protein
MLFDPNSPFDPTDPSQLWRLRNLPRTPVQPTAPPNAASGSAAESNGINVPEDDGLPNDWFAPEADGFPNDWFVPEADGFPNDWIYPGNQNAPAPAAAPPSAPPAPSPQANAANPVPSNRRAARFDPYEAFWSQMPASRVGAMAWHPSIFLSADSFSPQNIPLSAWGTSPTFSNPLAQYLPATYAPPDLPSGGILGGIPKMIAEQAKANDPWEVGKGGILGGIAKLPAAQAAANDPWATAANSTLGGIAKLQPNNVYAATSMFGYPSEVALGSGNRPPSLLDNLSSLHGDQPVPQSASGSVIAPDFMASPYMSGSATRTATVPLDPTGWGRIQLAAGDREKIDPEDIFDPLAPLRVDLYNLARFDLRQIQPNNYALSVPSLRAPGSAPTVDEIGALKYAYRIAQSTQPLADTASQIATLIEPFPQRFRTVSVLQTSAGTFVAPSGGVDLEEAQTRAIDAMGAIWIPPSGVDAEIAALEYAKGMGAVPQFIAASRPFCPSCRDEIRARGGEITSPNTAVFPRNIPSVAFPSR